MAEYIPTVVSECLRIVVCTRNRNWDNEEYKKFVVEPYNKVQEMQNMIEKEGAKPTVEQMKEALEMLRAVFKTKQVPIEEQIERFNEVFLKTDTRNLFQDFKMPSASDM